MKPHKCPACNRDNDNLMDAELQECFFCGHIYPSPSDLEKPEKKYTIKQFKAWLAGQCFVRGDGTPLRKGDAHFERNQLIKHLVLELEDKEDGLAAVVERNGR